MVINLIKSEYGYTVCRKMNQEYFTDTLYPFYFHPACINKKSPPEFQKTPDLFNSFPRLIKRRFLK